jgi:Flp pilus assembly protein TadD
MGWLWLAAIAACAIAALRFARLSRGVLTLAAAALMLGAAGYAVQQNAALPGAPAKGAARTFDVDPGLIAFRSAILRPDVFEAAALSASDDRLRSGDTAGAAQFLLDALQQRPRSTALWTRLGGAFADHDGGQVSPAAQFAFQRASALAPDAPGPPFFLGLAYVQAGEIPAARQAWLRALELTPSDTPYRLDIAERLVLLDRFMAMQNTNQEARR